MVGRLDLLAPGLPLRYTRLWKRLPLVYPLFRVIAAKDEPVDEEAPKAPVEAPKATAAAPTPAPVPAAAPAPAFTLTEDGKLSVFVFSLISLLCGVWWPD